MRPGEHGLRIYQRGAIPVKFENSPAPLDRVVLAVIGRVVKQMEGFADLAGQPGHALEELGSHATAFRAVVDLDLEAIRLFPLFGRQRPPPVLQAVDNEIAGLGRAAKAQVQAGAIFIDNPQGRIFLLAAHVMVGGTAVAACLSAPAVLANAHRGLAVHAQPFGPRTGLGIPCLDVGEDGVSFRNFFEAWP